MTFSFILLLSSDALVEMDTLRTQRARKLSEFFKRLRHPSENLDNRLDLLNEISEALSEENTTQIIELENLFQRERELLLCKLKDDSLEILRQRELLVFMDVIKDEERHKPESKKLLILEKLFVLSFSFQSRSAESAKSASRLCQSVTS